MKKNAFLQGIILVLCLLIPCSSYAVLKEADLDQTLKILRSELTKNYIETQHASDLAKMQSEEARGKLLQIMKQSGQNALMLYSQQYDYVFNLTYACNEATKLWENFNKDSRPFDKMIDNFESDIVRYDSLVDGLSRVPKFILSEESQRNRSVCLTLATAIKRDIQTTLDTYKDDIERSRRVRDNLKSQYEYAQERYKSLQTSIFVNGDQDYFSIVNDLPEQIKMVNNELKTKYWEGNEKGLKSQWGLNIIIWLFIFIAFYVIVAIILNLFLIRLLLPILAKRHWLPKRFSSEGFLKRRPYIIATTTVLTFGIILAIVSASISQNLVIMATSLLTNYAWLLFVVCISLLIRLKPNQLKHGLSVYMPVMTLGFIVFLFRIILVPNVLVNLIFPPILIIIAIWHLLTMRSLKDGLEKEDRIYSWITCLVLIFCVCSSWVGYTLLSVQVLIWWFMELTCLLTITFIYQLVKTWKVNNLKPDAPFSKRWLPDLFTNVIMPVAVVASVMLSIYSAAELFELTSLCWDIFNKDFVNAPNFKLSLMRVSVVIALYYVFKYIQYASKECMNLYFSQKENKKKNEANKAVMYSNAMNIIVWGIYILITMYTLGVGNTWLVVVSGGLATGVGFASKDILENIYYGISLMTGRIHIGDMIEIDGIRGVVNDMNYTSTMVEALDGSVIAFQNSQLFTKNYKNLTRNHGWELLGVPVGVAYGTNVHEAKDIITDAVMELVAKLKGEGKNWIDKSRGVVVLFLNFGNSSVDLKACCWVKVDKSIIVTGLLREAIYDALNAHNIEIPFPQTDVHIKKD